MFVGLSLAVAAAAGLGFAGHNLLMRWLKKRKETYNIFGRGGGIRGKMPEMQQIGHGNVKKRSHARDWELEATLMY